MIRPELEALLQGALDNTLTAEERAELARILSESPEARERAAELSALAGLIESLGPADAPAGLVDHVLAQVSHHPQVRHVTFQRGVAVNKKILFGLAAAAAIVLAVITYNSNPPATVGTEATIGAAQRAQAPQIAAGDVKLGDTSTQDILQTETFDAIMRDETLRNLLGDAEFRRKLAASDLKAALSDNDVRIALRQVDLKAQLEDQAVKSALRNSSELAANAKKFEDANVRALLSNQAMAAAFRDPHMREVFMRPGAARALAGDAFYRAMADNNFDAAMRNTAQFSEAMTRWARSARAAKQQ
jgi:hypothetical protein